MFQKIKKTLENLKNSFNEIKQKANEIKQKANEIKSKAADSIVTKIIYWFLLIFLWWPIKYSFLLMYYIFVWPIMLVLGLAAVGNVASAISSKKSSTANTSQGSQRNNKLPRSWIIQVQGTGNYWRDDSGGDSTNSQIISHQVQITKKRVGGKRVRAIYRDTGEVIDIA